jgi:hypothetical protein
VKATQDGGAILAGFTATNFLPLDADVFLVKTNSAGDTLWTRHFGGPGDDGARAVVELPGSGYAILGYTQSFGAGASDLYLVRTDLQGNVLWQRTYGGIRNDMGEAMCSMPGGGFLLTGSTASFGAGEYDAYLVRTNAAGDTLWTRTYGGTDLDGSADVRPATGGGAIFSVTPRVQAMGSSMRGSCAPTRPATPSGHARMVGPTRTGAAASRRRRTAAGSSRAHATRRWALASRDVSGRCG